MGNLLKPENVAAMNPSPTTHPRPCLAESDFPKFLFLFYDGKGDSFCAHALLQLASSFSDRVTRIGLFWFVVQLDHMASYFVSPTQLHIALKRAIDLCPVPVYGVLSCGFVRGFVVCWQSHRYGKGLSALEPSPSSAWDSFFSLLSWDSLEQALRALFSCLLPNPSTPKSSRTTTQTLCSQLDFFCSQMRLLRAPQPHLTPRVPWSEFSRRFGSSITSLWQALLHPEQDLFHLQIQNIPLDVNPHAYQSCSSEVEAFQNRDRFHQKEGASLFCEVFMACLNKLTVFQTPVSHWGIVDFEVQWEWDNGAVQGKPVSLRHGIFESNPDTLALLRQTWEGIFTNALSTPEPPQTPSPNPRNDSTSESSQVVYLFEFIRSVRVIPIQFTQRLYQKQTLFSSQELFHQPWQTQWETLSQKSLGFMHCVAFGVGSMDPQNPWGLGQIENTTRKVPSQEFLFRNQGGRRPLGLFKEPKELRVSSLRQNKVLNSLRFLEIENEHYYYLFSFMHAQFLILSPLQPIESQDKAYLLGHY